MPHAPGNVPSTPTLKPATPSLNRGPIMHGSSRSAASAGPSVLKRKRVEEVDASVGDVAQPQAKQRKQMASASNANSNAVQSPETTRQAVVGRRSHMPPPSSWSPTPASTAGSSRSSSLAAMTPRGPDARIPVDVHATGRSCKLLDMLPRVLIVIQLNRTYIAGATCATTDNFACEREYHRAFLTCGHSEAAHNRG